MDKKVTTVAGIALGVSLIAGAGFGIYKYFSKKRGHGAGNGIIGFGGGGHIGSGFTGNYIGNGLVKSKSLYDSGTIDNGLIGGGLYKAYSVA